MKIRNKIQKMKDAFLKKQGKIITFSCLFVGLLFLAHPLEISMEDIAKETTFNKNSVVYDGNFIVSIQKQAFDMVKQSLESTKNEEHTSTILKENNEKPTTNEETTIEIIVEEETSKDVVIEPVSKEETISKEETSQNNGYTSDEILLLRIASCEAGDQGVVGMAYVIKVVLNRVESNEFPNNIRDVIYEKKQFSAIHTHWWSDEYIAKGAEEALALVYSGWDETEGALFFCMPCSNSYHSSKLEYIKTYKGHEFYK